jgi:hypothetical protein
MAASVTCVSTLVEIFVTRARRLSSGIFGRRFPVVGFRVENHGVEAHIHRMENPVVLTLVAVAIVALLVYAIAIWKSPGR